MKTNRQIKRDILAEKAYKLYLRALERGLTNQQAIDEARQNRAILVSERCMRNYIRLMEGERV